MTETTPRSGYAPVNGLQMYYEIHGQGEPLLLLHGAFGTIELWGPILDTLAANRQVVAVELQGHGRTVDIDRPLTYEQLAGDVAAFMRHLGIAQADVFGYSLGGIVALGLAIANPNLVRKLVVVGAVYNNDAYYPESLAAIQSLTPEMFAGTPLEVSYKAVAPDPDGFPALVAKVVALDGAFDGWREVDLQEIAIPALIVNGDADIRPEHAVQLFRLLGGGVPGDLVGLPPSRLAILPGTTHVGLVTERADWLLAMTEDFLAGPMADQTPAAPEAATPTATAGAGTHDLVVTRRFAAPVDRVWDAWREPEQVKRWWGPKGFTVPVAEIDFRVGGTSLVCMRSPDGHDLCNTWTYQEIVPRERIEFVLRFADDEGNALTPAEVGLPPAIPAEVRHVITFAAVGDETEMTVVEYGYPSAEIVALSKAGLEETLDKLAVLVAHE